MDFQILAEFLTLVTNTSITLYCSNEAYSLLVCFYLMKIEVLLSEKSLYFSHNTVVKF